MSELPTISLCVIGKNEANNLDDFWKMASVIVDELIYIDTGSTDISKEISRNAGAKVFDHRWDDDFSAARNFSLEKASCDYILILDPDEYIPPEEGKQLKKLLAVSPESAYQFTTRTYCLKPQMAGFQTVQPNDPHAKGAPGWVPSLKVRLFKNDPRIRFTGVINETIDKCIEKLRLKRVGCDFHVHHYGQLTSEEQIRKKQGFRKRLAEKKANLESGNFAAHYELGIILKEIGENEGALKSLTLAAELAPENPYVINALGNMYQLQQDTFEAAKCFEKAINLKSDYFDAIYNMGIAHFADENFHEAKKCLLHALALHSKYPPLYYQMGLVATALGNFTEAAASFRQAVNLGFTNWEVFYQLGLVLEIQKDYSAAIESYHSSLKINPKNAAVHCNLASIYSKTGNFDFAVKEYEVAAAIDSSIPAIKANLILIANFLKDELNHKLEQFLDADIIGDGSKAAPLAFDVEKIKGTLISIKEILKQYFL